MDRGRPRWIPSAGKPRADPRGRRSSGMPGDATAIAARAVRRAADVHPAWSAPTTSPRTRSATGSVTSSSALPSHRALGPLATRRGEGHDARQPRIGAATRTGRAAAARPARWATSSLRSDHWGGGALPPLRTVGTGTAWDHGPVERHSCSKTSASNPAAQVDRTTTSDLVVRLSVSERHPAGRSRSRCLRRQPRTRPHGVAVRGVHGQG
jgi:hypothetical protein